MLKKDRAHYRRRNTAAVTLLSLACLTFASCGYRHSQPERVDTNLGGSWPGSVQQQSKFQEKALPVLRVAMPSTPDAEYVNDDELCLTCHNAYGETMAQNVHRGIHEEGQACEACHGPASRHLETRGKEPGLLWNFRTMQPAQAAEVCLKCHENNACAPGARWRTSVHAHANLSCTSCHTAHYNVPAGTPPTTEPGAASYGVGGFATPASFQEPTAQPSLAGTSNNLNASAPNVCYRCHGDKADLQKIAGPHQICGPNGFNCTTCHDSHGKILQSSRQDLCLSCHESGSPTMTWHSSTHAIMGVACTDCHDPHPDANVPTQVGISYFNVARPQRLPMSVNDPVVCFKCHGDVFAKFSLPSHHPVKEGKMFCGDCHNGHGELEGNLRADTLNLLCWKCHADKQGPFAYEHPPVTENCAYCHSPHGAVANNLLLQPATFLCLRCHVGHRDGNHGGGARVNIDTIPQLRAGLYSDCTTCHSQIHGSDLPTPHFPGMFR